MSVKKQPLRILLWLLLGSFSALFAQEPPLLERGVVPGALSSLDHVNTSNGQASLRIPIGPNLTIGGNLEFGLTLVYNSKAWDTQGGVYTIDLYGNIPDAYPSRKSNAGIGWTMHLGKLIPPRPITTSPLNHSAYWMYIGPDGGSHLFYPFLHYGDPIVDGVYYTRDGSYMRMQEVAGGGHIIEGPDGIVREFDNLQRIRKIYDRYPNRNQLTIDYDIEQSTGYELWTVTDNHNRVWVLTWTKTVVSGQHSIPEEDRTYDELVSVEVPAPNNRTALYRFHYQTRTVFMGCFAPDPETFQTTIRFLDSVEMPDPDGAGPQQPQHWEMVYYDDDLGNYFSCSNSALSDLVLPTGGRIHFDYRNFKVPAHCNDPHDQPHFFTERTPWVSKKQYLDIDGSLLAEWSYIYKLSSDPQGQNTTCSSISDDCGSPDPRQRPEVLTTMVIDPIKDRYYHFNVIWNVERSSEHGFNVYDYGLNYIKPGVTGVFIDGDLIDPNVPISAQDEAGRFLSSAVYDCNEDKPDDCSLFEATYLKYESENPTDVFYDLKAICSQATANATTGDRNARVVSQKKVFFGGGETQMVIADYENFDGLGNFRKVTTRGFPNNNARVLETNFNPGVPNLVLDSDHDPVGYTMLGRDKPWVLGTYDAGTFTENGKSAHSRFVFDAQTGYQRLARQYLDETAPFARNPHDLVFFNEHDGSGNTIRHQRFGADFQELASVPLEDLDLSTPGYREVSTYRFGVPESMSILDWNGSVLLREFSYSIDRNSGLATSVTDMSGVTKSYEFDLMGRVTRVDYPAPYSDLTIEYFDPAGNLGPKQRSLRRGPDGSNVEVYLHKDGFGRNIAEFESLPDGRYSRSDIEYGDNGLVAKVYEPYTVDRVGATGEQLGYTTWSDYDPKLRPGYTRQANGTEVWTKVAGECRFSTESFVRTSFNQGRLVEKAVYKDDRDRLVKVIEDATGSAVETQYEYDHRDNLTRVWMPGSVNQERRFIYDGLGRLTRERHPEKGIEGNGRVDYSGFDQLGNARITIDGPHQIRRHFDAAGRLIQVWDHVAGRIMEEAYYGVVNLENGNNRVAGRLYQNKRHNYGTRAEDPDGDQVITQTFYYRDPLGKVTGKRTRASSGISFGEVFEYDQLGQLSRWFYPHQHMSQLGSDRVQRVDYGYRADFLNSLNVTLDNEPGRELVSSVDYDPKGHWRRIVHGNGVSDHWLRHGSGLGIPQRIHTTGADYNWDSGDYQYDGSGNIKQIGDWLFAYDPLHRLIKARIAGVDYDYSYDRFGNMLNRHGMDLNVDSATNRISDPDAVYDGAGNQVGDLDQTYWYDCLGAVVEAENDFAHESFVYAAGNERICIIDLNKGRARWTLRDSQNNLVREYVEESGGFRAVKDYFYAHGLTASMDLESSEAKHYHKDHLNSTRLITDEDGLRVSAHDYLPFGEELNPDDSGEVLKFAGHERDASDRDYMHARYYNPESARFLATDPVLGNPADPQTWNRYSYVTNNPLRYVDPNGEWLDTVLDAVGVGMAIVDVVKDPSLSNVAALALEVGAAVVPGVPSPKAVKLAGRVGESLVRWGDDAVQVGDKINDARRAADRTGDVARRAPGPDEGVIYRVAGDKTPSGKPYVGSSDDLAKRNRTARDGRDRTDAEIVGTYPKGDRDARRVAEQKAINDNGGVARLDNKRNEIAESKWEEFGIEQ